MLSSHKAEYEPLISPERISLQPDDKSSSRSRDCSTRKTLLSVLALLATAVAVYFLLSIFYPSSMIQSKTGVYNWVQMEATHAHAAHIPKSWMEKEECSDDHTFTLTLALKQQHTDALHEHIMAVSTPGNERYHQYWSAQEVRNHFKPSEEAMAAVTEWLEDNGFGHESGKMEMVTSYGNAIRLTLTCGDANQLLNAKYMFYESTQEEGKTHLRVKDGIYNIPDTVHPHIDFVSPTIRFPIHHHTLEIKSMTQLQMDHLKQYVKDMTPGDFIMQEDHAILRSDAEDSDKTPNIPSRIFGLYGVQDNIYEEDSTGYDKSECRQAVASFIEQYYDDNDIHLFHTSLDVSPESTMERLPATQPQGYGSEAELDTQYMTTTGKGIYTYVYYIESDDIFVTLAEQILDTDTPPLVVSISYGADEYELGQDWVERCNEEFGKLALIGTTVLASSGDAGIRGNDDDCLYSSTSSLQQSDLHSKKGKDSSTKTTTNKEYVFVTSFPATAPYVTAVGGTEGGSIPSDDTTSTGETAWLYSGGGFSIYFDAPDWQQSALSNYFSQDIDYPEEARYASTGRAYPDISAQSVDYVIAYDSKFYLVSGTSASSPTVAGMVSMINYARMKDGKEPLGFLNPTLYSLYDENRDLYFNDVTEGYNIGCEVDSNQGFTTAEGWDPVTGVGTPRFGALYQALLDLD